MQKLDFFSSFSVWVFIHYRRFSAVRNCDVFWNCFYWNISSCDPQIGGKPKNSINIDFPLCWNSLLSKNIMPKHFIQVSKKDSTCERVLLWKICGLCLASQSLKSGISEKCLRYWQTSLFKLIFLRKYRFASTNQNLKWKPYSSRGEFNWETIDFDHCVKIMLVQNFQKVLSKWFISIFEKTFLRNYRFDLLHEGHKRQPYIYKESYFQFSVGWFFASKSGHSQKLSILKFLTFVDTQCHIFP